MCLRLTLPTFALNFDVFDNETRADCRALTCMQLLDPLCTFVQHSVNGSRYCECTTNDGANADKEAREALASCFTIDDLHG